MKLFDFFGRKALPATQSAFILEGAYGSTPDTIKRYVQEGYVMNPVVYHCISIIARAAASVDLEIYKLDKSGKEVLDENSKVMKLLDNPNPTQSWCEFIQEAVTWDNVAGEIFILRLPEKGPVAELWLLDPSAMEVKAAPVGGIPAKYIYGSGESKKTYPVNPTTGESQILHIKRPNPSSPWRGLSPLAACARDVDILNAGGRWNSRLLTNSARPSGVVELGGSPTEDTVQKIKSWFRDAWQGSNNAGSLPVLAGGAKFTPLSHNPKDMDFANSMANSSKNVALALGVPLPLVTMDAATFSNMDTAVMKLWLDTVLPTLDRVLEKLEAFLKVDGCISYNMESITALEPLREKLFNRMRNAVAGGIMTPDEAREEMGYDPLGGNADMLMVPQHAKPIDSLTDPTAATVDALVKAYKDMGNSHGEAVKRALADVGHG